MKTLLTILTFIMLPVLASAAPQTGKTYRRGINIAGAEYGPSAAPGNVGRENFEYTWNNEATYKYFTGKGLDLFRVPIRWERMQPELNGPLDPQYLAGLKRNIAWAKQYGAQIIIDIHNYGAYYRVWFDTPNPQYPTRPVPTTAHLNDLWVKLSNEFKNEPAVYAYDLMNEPAAPLPENGGGTAGTTSTAWKNNWKRISQSCLLAIRKNGDAKLIMIEGDAYAAASNWIGHNDADAGGWISDPADNYMYSAHCYFDQSASGTYTNTFDAEITAAGTAQAVTDRALLRILDFINWCEKHGYRGYIGEYGIPASTYDHTTHNNHHPDDRWLPVLDAFMTELDAAGMDATYWQASIMSLNSTDPLGALPPGYDSPDGPAADAPQISILVKHLSKLTPGDPAGPADPEDDATDPQPDNDQTPPPPAPATNNTPAGAAAPAGAAGGGAPTWWSLAALTLLIAARKTPRNP
jgi:aryl-phospho-beta-D-glucosidase BglC (GH1 family)